MVTLVVDDDPAIRSYVQSILRAEGFETLEAEDGAQALEVVRMLDGSIELIVTDIQMPGSDGITLANAVRAAFPSVAILLMSGYPRADADFPFLEKPFSWAVMRNVVRQVLNRPARVA
jgi:two-component system, cell cycle response regulator CpdR